MRVGVFQCAGGGLTPDKRLERLSRAIRGKALDLVVCPELFLSGYNVGEDVARLAEPVDGPFRRKVAEIARAEGTAVVYGYPERCPERPGNPPWNAAAAIGADGELLANHRKLVIPPGIECGNFTAGDGLTLFDLCGLCCAILICYDAEFPEAVRSAALAGAQMILVPTALAERWNAVARQLIPARAFENGAWLLYANHAGEENGVRYLGQSCIIDPMGEDRARADSGECLISATLDRESVDAARERLPYLADLPGLRERLWSGE
jgi:predicted amidohydrolase